MKRKIFRAGATGAIGKRLVPLLVDAGHEVFGPTRSEKKAAGLQAAAVTPIVVDVFDAAKARRKLDWDPGFPLGNPAAGIAGVISINNLSPGEEP